MCAGDRVSGAACPLSGHCRSRKTCQENGIKVTEDSHKHFMNAIYQCQSKVRSWIKGLELELKSE